MGSSKIIMILLLGVIFTLMILLNFPPLYAKFVANDVAIKSAYAVTEKIISATNIISSYDEYAIINISFDCRGCSFCRISFYDEDRYIKTSVTYVPNVFMVEDKGIESSFGLFTLMNYTAPQKTIDCTTPKKLIIEKDMENITIYEEGWDGTFCGGLNEPCCTEDKCAEELSCNSTGYCKKCNRYCPPKSCSGDWWSRTACDKGCITEEKSGENCITETEDPPECSYKIMDWGCRTRHCVAECYVDCERCSTSE